MTPTDPPQVAAEIEAMKSAWRTRFLLACLTMAAIVGFFAFDMRGDERMAAELLKIAPWFLGLALVFFGATQIAVAHQTKQIRAKYASAVRRTK